MKMYSIIMNGKSALLAINKQPEKHRHSNGKIHLLNPLWIPLPARIWDWGQHMAERCKDVLGQETSSLMQSERRTWRRTNALRPSRCDWTLFHTAHASMLLLNTPRGPKSSFSVSERNSGPC